MINNDVPNLNMAYRLYSLEFLHYFQNFAPLPTSVYSHIHDIQRAGVVFLRDGATTVSPYSLQN